MEAVFIWLYDKSLGFDWEGEIWETLLHELRHHLEFLAGRDDLVAEDLEYLRRYREGKRRRPTTE